MSYRWFKEWADKSPKTIVLIETREGFESFGTCATVVFRLIGAPMFRPNKKEKTKEPEVLVPMRDYPTLLDKMNRCQISYLVAREDFKVYSKEFDSRFYDIYSTPLRNPEKANEEDLMDRGLSVDDRVSVKNLETRKECCWKLVPPAEADVSRREKSGNLSIESVVGNALLGHRVGEDLTIVRGLNDTATYRILFALDNEDRKLKKIKREKVSKATLAEEAAEEDDAKAHLADIAAYAETEGEGNLDFLNPEPEVGDSNTPVTHLTTQNAHVSSALMNGEGPVMVFKEKTPEELAAEAAERERLAAEQAALAAESSAEAPEMPEFAAEAPAFADETPEFAAETPAFADEMPGFAAETPAFAVETPEFAAETPAFPDEAPVEFISPVAVSDEMPATVMGTPDFAAEAPAFPDETTVATATPDFAAPTADFAAPAASTSIVPFATPLSEVFFGPKKAGKAKHAAAKRFKLDLPKSAKHVKTRAMRKLEKLAARQGHGKKSVSQV